jgi:hypothetical protein
MPPKYTAAGTVVPNNLLEHRGEGARVDRFVLANRHGAGGLIVVPGGNDSLRIGDDGAIVEKDIDVIPRRLQGADIALQHKVRTVGALDGFAHVLVGGMDQLADLAADGLLPVR